MSWRDLSASLASICFVSTNSWGWCEEEAAVFSYMLNVLEVLISGSWFQHNSPSTTICQLFFFFQHHLSINICASFLLPRALMFRVQCHWTASQSPFFPPPPVSFGPCLARERLGAGVLRWVSHPLPWSSHPPSPRSSSEIQILLASSSGKIAKDLVSPGFPWR